MSMSLYYFIFPPNFYPETKCKQLFETIIELDYPDQYKIEDFEESLALLGNGDAKISFL